MNITVATDDALEDWRAIHNAIVPTHLLSESDVAERAGRNRLTLGHDGDELVGNATVRPPQPDSGVATVIVRILPAYRRRGLGSAYLRAELAYARSLDPRRIETVVLASNADGLAFAVARGFVEHDRYVLPGESTAFIDLHLADRGSAV